MIFCIGVCPSRFDSGGACYFVAQLCVGLGVECSVLSQQKSRQGALQSWSLFYYVVGQFTSRKWVHRQLFVWFEFVCALFRINISLPFLFKYRFWLRSIYFENQCIASRHLEIYSSVEIEWNDLLSPISTMKNAHCRHAFAGNVYYVGTG